jgi:pilus assembly protein CpaB
MPPLIPLGMRAMSVRVNDVVSVAGYTTPGTRVDVVVTSRSGEESMTRTVLSNVQVLAAGTRYEEDRARKEAMPTTVVTVLVTPADGEKLTLAQSQGQLTLALRNPLDIEATKTAGVRMRELLAAPGAEPIRTTVAGRPRVITPPPPPPPPPPPSIEMINGTQKKREVIGGAGGGAGSF